MGTSCGPVVACLYLSYYEIKYQSLLNSFIYFRYIDDIFIIKSLNFTINFKDLFPDLELTTVNNEKISNFLDIFLRRICISKLS